MKTFKGFLYGLAIAIAMSAGAATIYNYFPPPGITYSPTTGTVFGTATGGAQGTGTVNAQGLYVNGTAVNTGGAPGSNTQIIYNSSGLLAASSLLTFTPGTVVENIGAATTPGTFSVGQLDSMVINGVTVPIPGFALNSNIQGVFENHSYVNGVASGGARYYGVRSEGTISSPAIVVNGDHLSTFYAAGYNGSSYSLGGDILFQVNGTPGASAMPSDMLVQLSPTGSQVPVTVATFSHTGNVTIGVPQSGTSALTVNGVSSSPALTVQGNTGTGTGQGILVQAGTNSSDYALLVKNASGATTMAQLFGDGGLVLNGATGGDQGAGTLNMSGCFVNGVACSTGGATAANPTGTVGLTAVNGVAGTYIRSDGAPALSQAIVPTWTGAHTFSAASTVPITVNNNGTTDALDVKGSVGRSALIEFAGNGNTAGSASMAVGQDVTGNSHVLARNAANLLLGTSGTNFWSMASTGAITQTQPSSGTSFTLNVNDSTNGLILNDATTLTNGFNVAFENNGTTRGIIGTGPSTFSSAAIGDFGMAALTGTLRLGYGSGATTSITIGQSGNVSILAAASGSTLTITPDAAGATTAGGILVNAPASGVQVGVLTQSGQIGYAMNSSGSNYGFIQNDSSNKWCLATGTVLNALGSDSLCWYSTNGTTVGAPTGGDKGSGSLNAQALYVNGASVLTTTSGGATKFASGLMTTSGGNTCTINTNGGGLASCTEAAAGRPVVNLTTGYFPTAFFCTATAQSANLSQVVNTNGINLNSLQVYITASTTGANNDGSFQLVCMGN